MPDVRTIHNFDDLTPADLDAKRREILDRAAKQFDAKLHKERYEALSYDDLAELAAVCASLRRRSAGPPKEAKARSAPVKKASLEDLTGDL